MRLVPSRRTTVEFDRLRSIKLIGFDVDGILTDGRLLYGPDGAESKAFHVHDGLGLKLLAQAGIITCVISARASDAAARRIDLERPEVLPEWLYAIQRGKHKTEALERYAPERVRILDATCGHTDGEGFHIPADSVVTTRISEKTVKIIASIDPKLRPPRIPLRAHLAAAIGSLPTSVQLRNEFVQDINNIKHAVTFLFGKFRSSSAPDELKKSKNTAA